MKPLFIFGTQYYRAPTPTRQYWAGDLAKISELGMKDVKFWVQWRWGHRGHEEFYFDDLDELMDIAATNDLRVTLNVIFDVAPLWLYEDHPDAKQVLTTGQAIEPYALGHRQIGGHPGPCYNHPATLEYRKKFLAASLNHFAGHPAMFMWDVWNEPEQSFYTRNPDVNNLICYCDNCRDSFHQWLQKKYENLDTLNNIWGRCYDRWNQVELPRTTETINDFIDWREFHLDTMKHEADWRLAMTKDITSQPAYLHIVPNTMQPFNCVSCVDDFAMSENCDIFAATMNASPNTFSQVISAADGKKCYNVESHINFGSTNMHPRNLKLDDVLADLLPQIGWGIKGFMFWQYRAETLGLESPAWGLVNADGSDRSVIKAVAEFYEKLKPFSSELVQAISVRPEVGVWKSRRNEIFSFCIDHTLDNLADAVNGYIDGLYWNNVPFRIVNESMLEKLQLDGLKLLILPSPYYLSQGEVDAIDTWVRRGGVVLCDAHLCGYNATTGRHSSQLPGGGLTKSWGIAEVFSTSPRHLDFSRVSGDIGNVTADTLKALKQSGKVGGNIYPTISANGETLWAASRFACIEADNAETIANLPTGEAVIIRKNVGNGQVWYCGGNIGQAATYDEKSFDRFLQQVITSAAVTPTLDFSDNRHVHMDVLTSSEIIFLVIINRSSQPQKVTLHQSGWRSVFTKKITKTQKKKVYEILPYTADILLKTVFDD